MTFLWSTLAGAVPLAVGVYFYNRLVQQRNLLANSFSQIDVQLTRRYELVPNLVAAARGYLDHEKDTLEGVIQARTRAVAGLSMVSADPSNASAMKQLSKAESQLSSALGRLMALSESYPELKANTTIQQLSEELTSTENRVAFARQAYNDSVFQYNNLCETFPSSLVAGSFSFLAAEPFRSEFTDVAVAPSVSFA